MMAPLSVNTELRDHVEMSIMKIAPAMGLLVGTLLGTASEANAWWTRSASLQIEDNSSMRKVDATTVNIHGFITANGNRAHGRLCRKVWSGAGAAATVCSTTTSTPLATSAPEAFTLQMASKLGTWTAGPSDFGYITLSADNNQAQLNGVFISN